MRRVEGSGCWPGRAEGVVVWASGGGQAAESGGPALAVGPVEDRAAEIQRFRAEAARAAADLEAWCDRQQTLEQRVLLQSFKEALLEDAWSHRACALIDTEGVPAGSAALRAARQVAAVLAESEELAERAERLEEAARWLAGRVGAGAGATTGLLAPAGAAAPAGVPGGALPPDAILAAESFTPLELLDLRRPALIAGPEPPLRGSGTLVWGVPGLGPDWHGRRVATDGAAVVLDPPDARWWRLDGDRLNGLPVCVLNGNTGAIRTAARRAGRPPAVLVRRLDDLAALPLYIGEVAAVALDLDGLGPAPRLKHPGFGLLLKAALGAAAARNVPILAGGEPAARHPDYWLSLGFTALYDRAISRGGRAHVVRGGPESGL